MRDLRPDVEVEYSGDCLYDCKQCEAHGWDNLYFYRSRVGNMHGDSIWSWADISWTLRSGSKALCNPNYPVDDKHKICINIF